MYAAYVTRIKNLRKHSNADRLLCGECFGNTVIVGLDTKPEELGVYFPVDGKLGTEYAVKNDLLRRKDENGRPAGGYLDPEKRNIKALKLRGEKSDGLFMPLSSLSEFTDIAKLCEGDVITILNGVTICEKYIPRRKKSAIMVGGVGLVSIMILLPRSLRNMLTRSSLHITSAHFTQVILLRLL